MTGIEATIALSPALSAVLIVVGIVGLLLAIVGGIVGDDSPVALMAGAFIAVCGFGGQHLLLDKMHYAAQDAIEIRYNVEVLGDVDWDTLQSDGTLPVTVKPASDTTIAQATLAYDGDRLTLFTPTDKPTQWGTPTD